MRPELSLVLAFLITTWTEAGPSDRGRQEGERISFAHQGAQALAPGAPQSAPPFTLCPPNLLGLPFSSLQEEDSGPETVKT
jgi:hypothetical protein